MNFSSLQRAFWQTKAPLQASLGLDFHSHLLPAVDDGMETLAAAKSSILALKAIGFSGAVLTPHIYKGVFNNTSQSLRKVFANFVAALQRDGVDFQLHLAGEYFADENFLKAIERDDLLSLQIGSERYVMLEFPYSQETPFASVCLAALLSRGYRPVVAHIERYRFVAQAPEEWMQRFARSSAVLQGDIGSLVGQNGEDVRRFANWLAEQNHISIWGTDIHSREQISAYIIPGLACLRPDGHLNTMLDPLLKQVVDDF
jgi:tyrosine-protein phosphatase YwqE